MVRSSSLSRDDWTQAALAALAERGVGAVAVEPLAASLGATKGSFYWHFADRADLLAATLERWEQVALRSVTAELDAVEEPAERLRLLFGMTFGSSTRGRVDIALMAASDDPSIAVVLSRVTAERIDYLERTFQDWGLSRAESSHRAVLAYTAWIGLAQLQHSVPSVAPEGAARVRYLDHLLAAITPLVERPAVPRVSTRRRPAP